ncbi:MAG TPA: hypothetical protein VNT79_13495 [Phycisphaerae bacterium]|nr:hypothetical protein [Phycisphaerae bacterium]
MRRWPKDEVVSDEVARILAEKTPADRLAIANQMFHFARSLIRNTLKGEHPDWEESRLDREVARRISHGSI